MKNADAHKVNIMIDVLMKVSNAVKKSPSENLIKLSETSLEILTYIQTKNSESPDDEIESKIKNLL